MTSRTSPPFKILFEKLIRTHHSCKSKKTPVYSYLKSIMPEKPRFEVHLSITKSNWNFQVWLFKQKKALEIAIDYVLAKSQNHMHFWTVWTQRYNFVKKTERLLALQDVVIGVKPPIHQVTTKILSCTPQFYRMSKKEHRAITNSRQKSSVNLDVTQHIWRKRPATKILNIFTCHQRKTSSALHT